MPSIADIINFIPWATIVFFSAFALIINSAVHVITAVNPVRGVLHLVFCFICTTSIWLLLNAEFLAMSLIVVYVGAVMVLFLFVIMMFPINDGNQPVVLKKRAFIPIIIVFFLFLQLLLSIIFSGYKTLNKPMPEIMSTARRSFFQPELSNTENIGTLLYSDYVYAFELAGILLMFAVIAAIAMTAPLKRKDTRKRQDINQQVSVQPDDRLLMITGKPLCNTETSLSKNIEN